MPSRTQFQTELARLEQSALGGLTMVVEQLDRVMEALAHQDIELAQLVVLDDDRLDGRFLEVQQGVLSLLALGPLGQQHAQVPGGLLGVGPGRLEQVVDDRIGPGRAEDGQAHLRPTVPPGLAPARRFTTC